MTSSQYGLYRLGNTRATEIITKEGDNVNWSEVLKGNLGADWSLQLGIMKVESLVITNQQVVVNMVTNLVHTARHAMGIGFG